MQRYWANKRLDATPADWWFGVRSCALADREDLTPALEARWDPSGTAVAGFSVRSLFDVWLSAQGWPPGDRIVFSAFTVADMPFIARRHGLEVVAVDIDPSTCEPDLDALRTLVDGRTRAVVYTHLFGARGDVDGALAIARAAGACFVEDCAEAYDGPAWHGDPRSDLALFSFGPIKNATAFGGGLARVADDEVRAEMRRLLAEKPRQRRREFLARALKLGGLAVALHPSVFGPLVRVLDTVGPGHDVVLQRMTRSFPGPDLLGRIRRRPAGAMVTLLGRRLAQGDAPIQRRRAAGEHLVAALDGRAIPAAGAHQCSYWLVPVLAPDPDALIARLAARRFHATRGRSFAVVDHDPGVVAPAPVGARTLFEHAVFLPFTPEMPEDVLDELAVVVLDELARQDASGRTIASRATAAPKRASNSAMRRSGSR